MNKGLGKNVRSISEIACLLKRSRNTLQKVGVFLRKGLTALQYLEQGQANKKRCDRKKAELSEEEKMLI